jgi:hypothetical protein
MKSAPSPSRPGPSTARRNWTEDLATQFWGEDDATTVFATPEAADALSGEPREPARKLRPRGRPRDLRSRRPGPRSPGFGGVWLPADALPTEPARSSRLGSLLAVGLVIFGVGLAAGRLFLGGPFAALVPLGNQEPPAVHAAAPAPVAAPTAPAAPSVSSLAAPAALDDPRSSSPADKATAPAKRRHHARGRHLATTEASSTDEDPSPDLIVPRPRSIVKVDALDLTLPDPGP